MGSEAVRAGGGGSGGSIRLVSDGNLNVAGAVSVDGGKGGDLREGVLAEVGGGGAGG